MSLMIALAPPVPFRFDTPSEMLDLPTHWVAENWTAILLAASFGAVIFLLFEGLRWIALALARHFSKPPRGGAFTILRRVVQKTSHIFLAVAAVRLVITYTEPPHHVFATVHFVFTIAAVLQAARWLRAAIFGFMERQADPSLGGNEALANASGLIGALVNGALIVVALVVILDNLGVNVTGLIAGLGIGGIAIGLAAQGIFSDLFASLSIIFDRPFRVGETIDFGKGAAVVERIGLKSTRLRAVTGERLIVSNAQLLGKEIVSYAGITRRRFTFTIGLIYQTTPEQAASLPDIVRAVVEGEGAQFVRAGFTGFGPSSLDFEIQFDVLDSDMNAVQVKRHGVGIALFRRLQEVGLSLAYPTQTTFTADPEGRMIMPYPTGNGPAR